MAAVVQCVMLHRCMVHDAAQVHGAHSAVVHDAAQVHGAHSACCILPVWHSAHALPWPCSSALPLGWCMGIGWCMRYGWCRRWWLVYRYPFLSACGCACACACRDMTPSCLMCGGHCLHLLHSIGIIPVAVSVPVHLLHYLALRPHHLLVSHSCDH